MSENESENAGKALVLLMRAYIKYNNKKTNRQKKTKKKTKRNKII